MADIGEEGVMTRPLRIAHRAIAILLAVILPLILYAAFTGREPQP